MNKNNREKVWKATAEKNNVNFVDDISNLNNDNSFAPINEEEERQPLTEEEKEEVRKKLFVLLIVIVAVLIFLIVVLIFDPFKSKKENNKKENQTEEKQEQEKPAEPEEPKKDNLASLQDGEIVLTNKEIQILINEIQYRHEEYFENDTLFLFKTDKTNITTLSDTNKLFLMSKTSEFNSLVKKSINENNLCGNKITIDAKSIQGILKDRFNTSLTKNENFIYSYYKDEIFIKTYKFVYANGNYEGSCYTPSTNINQLAEQQVIKATKDGTKLYIDAKVVFIKENGIYKDPTFKTIITKNGAQTDNYINSGNTYRYTYDISGVNYILTDVSLSK